MLLQLNVKNLATLASVDLELTGGCIAVTGDTGAGKSLILDALELALGARADLGLVRAGTERAQIIAEFDIERLPQAKAWLSDNELDQDDELVLRRTLSSEGRSRAYVNGTPISTSQLKELSEQLVLMHTQDANQKLLQPKYQLKLLDEYADQGLARRRTSAAVKEWIDTLSTLHTLRADASKADAERELLGFQVEELNAFNLQAGEFEQLDQEQRQLATGDTFIRVTEQTLALLSNYETGGIISHTEKIVDNVSHIANGHQGLGNATELLEQAAIALSEAKSEIQHALDQFDLDPERLQFVEERLAQIFQLARKHKIEPKNLAQHHTNLVSRLEGIAQASDRIPILEQKAAELGIIAQQKATELTTIRTAAAEQLSREITVNFPDLGMEHARLDIRLIPCETLSADGAESVQFFFQPNPGQQGGPLSKIASGGELSRVNLAIQVITATRLATPTLVFDEVDVGIGGKTAAKVGELLTALAVNAQVLVVTHQPQVAGQADQHLHVQKQSDEDVTVSQARLLSRGERIDEIARMLGGHSITESTRQAAIDLLRT
ncbi:MAG: DNA repair protein RecN [Pseudomonadota bacterium]|nr:DNA repair protein RecN [Pseudomonadota bacterium]MEE2820755.1 DNA repair protein RecN [Pseudomonadota bacterium]